MANDPGLAADTCIYMEAVTGDGGTHNSSVWWLSPDIQLTGPTSGPDKADPGQNNTVNVVYHRKPASSNCTTPGDESITIELWVGNPSLAMSPSEHASTALIQSIGSPFPAEGTSATQIINWAPPAGLPVTDPQSAGHKCLIARCYPQSLTPDPNDFHVPNDRHVAQHNICIVPCSDRKAHKHGLFRFEVSTINLNFSEKETVTLRAVADLRPDNFVRKVVLERLERTEGFRRLALAPPRGFNFDLPDFPEAEVIDHTKPGCLGFLLGTSFRPEIETRIQMSPKQFTRFNFEADLSGAKVGEAYIFHLTQSGSDNRAHGGLTIVMLATDA
ncbi:MAG: hypothetical protein DMF68_02565 [Acidobacteria bacterium]|nr:MAG: hypothetical protein DMF68_02565 [Acidobacteriota bacterium]